MSDRIKIVCMDCACKRTIALHKWNEAERYSRYYPNIRYAKCKICNWYTQPISKDDFSGSSPA